MKKVFIFISLTFTFSLAHAVVISSKTYNYIWNPFVGTQQYVTSIDTNSIQGSGVIVTTIAAGVLITSSGTFSGPLVSSFVFYTTTSSRPWVSACGTTPSIASYSTNQSGLITVGGGITASCTLNFGTPLWMNPPACIFTSNAAIASGTGSSTASVFTFGGTSITSDVVMYNCQGSY